MDTLDALANYACGALLGNDAEAAGTAIRSRAVWCAWHAVRRSYRNPHSQALEQGPQVVLAFDAQVCDFGSAQRNNAIKNEADQG